MSEKEIAIIPKETYVSIMGCRIALIEDTRVEGNQSSINAIISDQCDFNNRIGIVSNGIKNSSSPKLP